MANSKILYLEAEKRNFVEKFLIQNQNYWFRGEDGRIDYTRRMMPDPPWIYTKGRENQQCHFHHKILFDVLHHQGKVPIDCFDCWKVVLMPRNLEELVASYLLQLYLNRPSKAGTEGDRPNTDRLYGAYFYNTSVEAGRECHKLVVDTIKKQPKWESTLLGCKVNVHFYDAGETMDFSQGKVTVDGPPKVILKRGCTEFEQNCGPSDKWAAAEGQEEFEYIARDAFVQDFPTFRQSDLQIASVLQKWIHNAFKWGDRSYLMFTNGNRLFNPPVTYHQDTGGKENG